MTGPGSPRRRTGADGRGAEGLRPSHPTRAAALLMIGVVVFLVAVSVLAIR